MSGILLQLPTPDHIDGPQLTAWPRCCWPGGVGPMTIAMLLRNTLQAAQAADAREASVA